jgi:hypothetical protein
METYCYKNIPATSKLRKVSYKQTIILLFKKKFSLNSDTNIKSRFRVNNAYYTDITACTFNLQIGTILQHRQQMQLT